MIGVDGMYDGLGAKVMGEIKMISIPVETFNRLEAENKRLRTALTIIHSGRMPRTEGMGNDRPMSKYEMQLIAESTLKALSGGK